MNFISKLKLAWNIIFNYGEYLNQIQKQIQLGVHKKEKELKEKYKEEFQSFVDQIVLKTKKDPYFANIDKACIELAYIPLTPDTRVIDPEKTPQEFVEFERRVMYNKKFQIIFNPAGNYGSTEELKMVCAQELAEGLLKNNLIRSKYDEYSHQLMLYVNLYE